MLKISYHSPVPIYEQLVKEIQRLIAIGEFKPGDSLPPVRSLASRLDISINTVARAYHELSTLKVIEGNRRKGSYIRKHLPETDREQNKIFKETILHLLQKGYNRHQIESIFQANLSQIFD